MVSSLVGRESEVVCAIDDLHWLDASSAAVVEFALRRLGEERVQCLVSVRATELARAPIPALERDLEVEHLELGPLSVAALHRVLTQELGRTFPRPTLVRIARAAGGNPLYAIEIGRELDRRGEHDISGRVPVPQDLNALVRARVRALPAEARDALLRAAALARPDTETIDPVELAAAEEAGLVRVEVDGRIEFVHPLFASAVYSAAPAARLREAHRAVANLARDPEDRARHLALAAPGPDAAVVRELQAAARHARMRGSPDSAAELIELARACRPLPRRRLRPGDCDAGARARGEAPTGDGRHARRFQARPVASLHRRSRRRACCARGRGGAGARGGRRVVACQHPAQSR